MIDAIAEACGSGVARSREVPGGSINAALQVTLDDGRELFVKHRPDPPEGFYEAEAAGLDWLARAEALPLPRPVAVTERFLALEWIEAGARRRDFGRALGHGLAALHAAGADRHGATADGGATFIGPLPVPNEPAPGWPAFYGERRLDPVLRLAVDHGALPDGAGKTIERVIGRLDDLCGPEEPPARLHGDLWGGNVMVGPDGGPLLVDPAAYGGHREVDLAMLRLFGPPAPDVFDAYQEAHPLPEGHAERVDLYQLFPLLVHAVLFGGGYGASAARAAGRYA